MPGPGLGGAEGEKRVCSEDGTGEKRPQARPQTSCFLEGVRCWGDSGSKVPVLVRRWVWIESIR